MNLRAKTMAPKPGLGLNKLQPKELPSERNPTARAGTDRVFQLQSSLHGGGQNRNLMEVHEPPGLTKGRAAVEALKKSAIFQTALPTGNTGPSAPSAKRLSQRSGKGKLQHAVMHGPSGGATSSSAEPIQEVPEDEESKASVSPPAASPVAAPATSSASPAAAQATASSAGAASPATPETGNRDSSKKAGKQPITAEPLQAGARASADASSATPTQPSHRTPSAVKVSSLPITPDNSGALLSHRQVSHRASKAGSSSKKGAKNKGDSQLSHRTGGGQVSHRAAKDPAKKAEKPDTSTKAAQPSKEHRPSKEHIASAAPAPATDAATVSRRNAPTDSNTSNGVSAPTPERTAPLTVPDDVSARNSAAGAAHGDPSPAVGATVSPPATPATPATPAATSAKSQAASASTTKPSPSANTAKALAAPAAKPVNKPEVALRAPLQPGASGALADSQTSHRGQASQRTAAGSQTSRKRTGASLLHHSWTHGTYISRTLHARTLPPARRFDGARDHTAQLHACTTVQCAAFYSSPIACVHRAKTKGCRAAQAVSRCCGGSRGAAQGDD